MQQRLSPFPKDAVPRGGGCWARGGPRRPPADLGRHAGTSGRPHLPADARAQRSHHPPCSLRAFLSARRARVRVSPRAFVPDLQEHFGKARAAQLEYDPQEDTRELHGGDRAVHRGAAVPHEPLVPAPRAHLLAALRPRGALRAAVRSALLRVALGYAQVRPGA